MPTREKATKIVSLAEDIVRFAVDIVSSDEAACADERDLAKSSTHDRASLENSAKIYERLYRLRRQRDAAFTAEGIFSDPCWDILIDLFIAHAQGTRVSLTSAAIAACAPMTTALRWISILEKNGIVRRYPDAQDGRRVYITLTNQAIEQMIRLGNSF